MSPRRNFQCIGLEYQEIVRLLAQLLQEWFRLANDIRREGAASVKITRHVRIFQNLHLTRGFGRGFPI